MVKGCKEKLKAKMFLIILLNFSESFDTKNDKNAT